MKSILLFLFLIASSYCIKMTKVSRNSRISLPTTSRENKYFYVTNSEYNSYSNYIYILFEDDDFNLDYYNVKYCLTETNPYNNSDSIVNDCTFNEVSYR